MIPQTKKWLMIAAGIFLFMSIQVNADEGCGRDYDVSRISDIPIDDKAVYAFNEADIIVDRPIEEVFEFTVYEPLEILVPGTDSLPGVKGTRDLNDKGVGNKDYLRIVCLNDGNTAIEKVLENIPNTYFSYQVWDYSIKQGAYIEYAKGEFRFIPRGNQTHIKWRYSFKLNPKKVLGKIGSLGRCLFSHFFLEKKYNEFMQASLQAIKTGAENIVSRFP